jgi:hypothetical protein
MAVSIARPDREGPRGLSSLPLEVGTKPFRRGLSNPISQVSRAEPKRSHHPRQREHNQERQQELEDRTPRHARILHPD